LSELTEGEPLLVRFYAEDLWQLGHDRARITIADLDSLRPGFGSYFERWLSYQERLWGDEGARVDKTEVDQVLSILAFALGPLESCDLLALMKAIHNVGNLLSEHYLLKPLRRFIIGDGKSNSGYVLSHPKVGDYLQNERFRAIGATLRRGFTWWCQKHLRCLNAGDFDPKDASPYVLQFLKGHFEDAGLPTSEWMELVENGWRRAWEQFEGVPRGFAADVRAAWDVVRREAGIAGAPGWQWRCALVLSSIRSIGMNTPDALICAGVAGGRLSRRQATHFVEVGRSGGEAVALLLALSKLEITSAAQSRDLIAEALAAAKAIGNEGDRASALASLAPHLPREQKVKTLAEALDAAKAIGNEGARASALASLVPHLPSELLAEALDAAKAIGNEGARASALASLAPHLPPEQKVKTLAEALAAAKAIGSERARASALVSLAPHLPPELLAKALAAIGDESDRASALASLVPHLPKVKTLAEALDAAKAIRDEGYRARALASLAPHLPPEQKVKTLAEALAAAKAIDYVGSRASVLVSLAPHLPPEQKVKTLAEALDAAKAIRDEGSRARALASLAPHLPPEQKVKTLAEALDAAKAIRDEGYRARALVSLAPHLPPELLAKALAAAKAIGSEGARASVLVSLAPHLPPELLAKALAAAKAIGSEEDCARALESVAPHLPPELLAEALAAAKAIRSEEDRARAGIARPASSVRAARHGARRRKGDRL
jgi:predicted urease superfamily metal-dependent hydrolase